MHLAWFLGFVFITSGALFGLHLLRMRRFAGPFVMFTAFLWFLNYLTGQLGYTADFLGVPIRYSTVGYTLIFGAILLVYICEGIKESRNLILVSIGSQLLLVVGQFFLFSTRETLIVSSNPERMEAAIRASELVFSPNWERLSVSILAAVVALFFAVLFFQFLVNKLKGWPTVILVFLALSVTMALDSAIFLGLSYHTQFLERFPRDTALKILIVAIFSVPLGLYIGWFKKMGNLDLSRGSLDIFRKLENLEVDLDKANQELREYAETLEKKVEERTLEIQSKNRIMSMEMKMAADVQQAILPDADLLKDIRFAARYLPCSAVSGDIYDLGTLCNGQPYFFLADISGHGVPSALIGAMCRMTFQEAVHRMETPSQIMRHIAGELSPVVGSHFLTAVLVLLSPADRTLVFSNGAHNPPLLITPEGRSALLEPTGTIIGDGIVDEYTQKKARYPAGSRLLLYTDCLTEHKNAAREEFGIERLKVVLTEYASRSADEVLEELHRRLIAFGDGAALRDDLTMLLVDLP